MTITRKHEEFTASSGELMFIEQYHEKEWAGDVWFWRYGSAGIYGQVYADYLNCRPNKKLIMQRF